MANADAVTALRRFGLGPRSGEIKRIAGDPRGFVLAALSKPELAALEGANLTASNIVLTEFRAAQLARKEQKKQVAAAGEVKAASDAPAMDSVAATDTAKPGEIRREAFRDEAAGRIQRALTADTAYLERLVMFWSGHFCVSVAKGPVRAIAGAYEREAIRPHVLGRFADMLKAVEQHPAMLIYLDNAQSSGPNSKAGVNRKAGLNENLARETLELHTLGVDGGYSQTDVTNLARLITGWTVAGEQQNKIEPGRFMFAPNRHEPGTFDVLGRRYGAEGARAGEQCLDDLARHPATARHIATQLARHFVSDAPPPSLVKTLETAFRDSDGDLLQVSKALATAPEAWQEGPRKLIPPYDFLIALCRGLELLTPVPELIRVTAALGQPLWQPPSPAGWPEADNSWMAPSAIRERLRVAERAARETDRLSDPRAAADDLLGPAVSEPTRQAIAHAETREQGFEILIMSPEFMRR